MINNEFLPLPDNPDCYEDLKDDNCYFIDKTEYLKTILTDSSSVLLFIRPSGFGKTMLMTMLESFLQINPEKPFDNSKQLDLFKGTKILEDKEFCQKFMGQYPVIYINLKEVDGNNFDEAYRNFASTVFTVASRYHYLLDSPKLDNSDKEELKKLSTKSYLEKIENKQTVKDALSTLAGSLYKEYGRRAFLLIDEYDVPLAAASYHDRLNKVKHKDRPDFVADYHDKMVTLMKGFFDLLKSDLGDESGIGKAVMTGSLRVYKNSLISGMNFTPNCVDDTEKKYTGMFGFTEDETLKFLKDYGLDDCFSKVKEHYAGYKFFDKEIFNPVDVVNFVKDNLEKKEHGSEIKTGTYWCDLVSDNDNELNEKLDNLSGYSNQRIQDLVDGKSITFRLNDSMNYDILSEDNSDDIWSLLLHKGYLTIDWDATDALDEYSRRYNNIYAKLPNLEILECFESNIKERFGNVVKRDNLALNIANALLEGDVDFVQNKLGPLLRSFVLVRNTATKAPHENYYHGFLNGIFTNCKDNLNEYHSNYESGDGYADILFKDIDCRKVAIIEIKSAPTGSDLVTLSETALSQIEEKNYSEPFMGNRMIQSIYAYGIAFAGKNCFISCKKLK